MGDEMQGLMGPGGPEMGGGGMPPMGGPMGDPMSADPMAPPMEQPQDSVQSMFLDFSSNVLEPDEQEALAQVVNENPFIVDALDKVFGALTGEDEEMMEGDGSEMVSPGGSPDVMAGPPPGDEMAGLGMMM